MNAHMLFRSIYSGYLANPRARYNFRDFLTFQDQVLFPLPTRHCAVGI
jgi:hypothetical protein